MDIMTFSILEYIMMRSFFNVDKLLFFYINILVSHDLKFPVSLKIYLKYSMLASSSRFSKF